MCVLYTVRARQLPAVEATAIRGRDTPVGWSARCTL